MSKRGRRVWATVGVLSTVIVAGMLWRIPGRLRVSSDLRRNPDQNVLLVTIDTLRGDALGCDGGPARTPNIDRLAESGVRFSFAHAEAFQRFRDSQSRRIALN